MEQLHDILRLHCPNCTKLEQNLQLTLGDLEDLMSDALDDLGKLPTKTDSKTRQQLDINLLNQRRMRSVRVNIGNVTTDESLGPSYRAAWLAYGASKYSEHCIYLWDGARKARLIQAARTEIRQDWTCDKIKSKGPDCSSSDVHASPKSHAASSELVKTAETDRGHSHHSSRTKDKK